jgi:hypothetical protein
VLDHLLHFARIDATVLEEGEAPDFILALDSRRVGIEVTEYLRGRSATGSALRQQHRFVQSVLAEAKLSFEARNALPLWVTVDAEPGKASLTRDELAGLLVEGIKACLDGAELPTRPGPFGIPMPNSPLLHECGIPAELRPIMSRLTLAELRKGSVSRWKIRQSGDTRAHPSEIADLIGSKDKRYHAYIARCAEVWLVIDAFGADILQAITPTADVVQNRYRTAFGRVYVVDRAEPWVLQLQTESL